jgi:glycyl-tRNA synthetase beta chain
VAVEATAGPAVDALGAARTTWAALSLADKLDTIVGLFLAGERPTGSRDPFGLRRQAHGVLRLLLDAESFVGRRITTTLGSLVARVVAAYGAAGLDLRTGGEELQQFFKERLEFALESRGFDRRNIRAVLRARREAAEPSVIETVENLSALKDVSGSESFRQLATAFKRVRNIARELVHDGAFDAWDAAQPPLGPILVEPAERALLQEIDARRPLVESAIGQGRYREAYAAAAGFEPFVAAFFKDVFVMADDAALKTARLRVMKRLEHLVLQLGDISEIVATES